MDKMFRVLSFWTAMITLMAVWGHLYPMAALFFIQTVIFLSLGYMKLSERTYMYIFGTYCFLSFTVILIYTFFVMPMGGQGA